MSEYTPSRGQDKVARMNSISDIFSSGMVWAPKTHWAEKVVEEVAEFPNGDNDDMADTVTLALMRFRAGGFVQLPSDEKDDPLRVRVRKAAYY
jgi:phage terminase large subunit-like protein